MFVKGNEIKTPEFFLDEKTEAADPADRGTATHLFLQFCDFNKLKKNGVESEIGRLLEYKFIPKAMLDIIYRDELELIASSELMEKILSAKKIIREHRFNVMFKADSFSKNKKRLEKMEGEGLAVQGVIDLIIIDKDDNITLIDYKTDRLSDFELKNYGYAKNEMIRKHKNQLWYYAKAIESLFGRPCKEIAIYSTHSAKLYQIKIPNMGILPEI